MNKRTTQPQKAGKPRGKYLATRYKHIVRYPGNNILYLYWKHKGRRYELSLETEVESVALTVADEKIKDIKERLADGPVISDGKLTFGALLTNYLDHH